MDSQGFMCHDDAITIRAQKHEVRLGEKWWESMVKDERLGWFNLRTNENRREDEYLDPEEVARGEWRMKWSRKAKIEGGYITTKESYVDIVMNNLWGDFGTRYREALDGVVAASEKGILAYSPRAFFPEDKERNRLESMRVRVKKYFSVVRYEHNLVMLDDDLGESLMSELWAHEEKEAREIGERARKEGREWNTIYIKGFAGTSAKEKPNLVKVYRDDDLGGKVKIEVTLRNGYLKRHRMNDVGSAWETQTGIQAKIQKALTREWKALFEKAPLTGGMLMERMPKEYKLHGRERDGRVDLLNFMVSTRNTFTEVKARLENVEVAQAAQAQAQADLAARVARLEGGKGEKPI